MSIFGKVSILFCLLLVYISWFDISKTLSSGDWSYLYWENIKEFSFLPDSGFFWFTPYYQISAKILVKYIGLSWNLAEKILWFWPFIIISIASSFYFTRSWIGVLIYTASTYPLMLVGGGQMGVAIAYAFAPLVLGSFIKLIDNLVLPIQNIKYQISNIKYFLLIGLILAVQAMFDPRISYVTFIAIVCYLFLNFIFDTNKRKFLLNSFILLIPVLISLVLNSFWITAIFKHGFPSNYEGYSSILGFRFLSFTDFSHAFSILHPNWPENIFGKVYFTQSEFIILPILAYTSLFFISSKLQIKAQNLKVNSTIKQYNNLTILFFAFLGLTGTFLAKGSNPPFGQVNEFLFQFFPGMSMFRDPTKFYLLIVLSYSILMPFTIQSIYDHLSSKFKVQSSKLKFKVQNYIPGLFLIFAILYLIFLIRPALLGQLGGTFRPKDVPREYFQLKNFLSDQPEFFKTLWLPERQRFGFYSNIHPAVSASDIFRTSSMSVILKEFEKKDLRKNFLNNDIKYVIVPYDSEGEIFLEDRKYSEKEYEKILEKLKKVSLLTQVKNFGDIVVFQVR